MESKFACWAPGPCFAHCSTDQEGKYMSWTKETVNRKSNAWGPKVDPKWSPKWSPNGSQTVSKWSPNGPKWIPNSKQSVWTNYGSIPEHVVYAGKSLKQIKGQLRGNYGSITGPLRVRCGSARRAHYGSITGPSHYGSITGCITGPFTCVLRVIPPH